MLKRLLISFLFVAASLAANPIATTQAAVLAGSEVVYESAVTPLPPSQVSLPFQAQQTGEMGDAISLEGLNRAVSEVGVTFVTWAPRSAWPDWAEAAGGGWEWPVVVRIYEAGQADAVVGELIAQSTSMLTVPWRPEATTGCSDSRWAPDGDPVNGCYSGYAFNASLQLDAATVLPDSVVVTVAMNTQTYGAEPTGAVGPYNSLNIALRAPVDGAVPVGTDSDPSTMVSDKATDHLEWRTDLPGYTPAFTLAATGGSCEFRSHGTSLTLVDDCTTDQSIAIPTGYTFDGAGHEITAVDPAGGHFRGGVLTNHGSGGAVTIRDVSITAEGLADICDGGGDRLRAILLDGAGGIIDGVNVAGVRQGTSGCQEGNAIEARNFESDGTTPASSVVSVSVTNSVVSGYQKNGITFNGGVAGTAVDNVVIGDGPVSHIAQNGIQVGFGASAEIRGNRVEANYYTGSSATSCGLLFYEANGVRQSRNKFEGNQANVCNSGRGGGSPQAG